MSGTDPSPGEQTLILQQALNLAMQHHTAGDLPKAEDLYQRILQTDPDHPDALRLLGVISHQRGEIDIALNLINKALTIKPNFAEAHTDLGGVLRELGQLDDVVSSYQKALAIKPNYAEAHYNLGLALQELGQVDEAVASYHRAIAIKPDFPEAHNNLGAASKDLGKLDQAVASCQTAIDIKPNYAEAHNNLGNANIELGRLDEAVASCQKAIEFRPKHYKAHNNLGVALNKLGKLDEAVESFQMALNLKPDFAEAHSNLGNAFKELGRLDEAVASYRRALELNPNNINACVSLANNLDRLVPLWHIPMMNDHLRNDAYLAALQAAVTADSHVLEIGTGFGLLAMMAARCSAEQVTTCEVSPLIAATAKEIISTNGMADTINVIAKKSTNLEMGVDLPRPADLLVFEIFSSEFLAEGVLSGVEDAKRRLLSPEGRVIPSGGSIMIALFGGKHVGKNIVTADVSGFDMSKSNSITSKRRCFRADHFDIQFLTEDVEAFTFDFNENNYFPPEKKILKISITTAAKCYGIIQWNRMQMDDLIIFENHPSIKTTASGWTHVAYLFDKPISVEPNQTAIVSAMHNRVLPWFALEDIEKGS